MLQIDKTDSTERALPDCWLAKSNKKGLHKKGALVKIRVFIVRDASEFSSDSSRKN